MNEIVSTRMPVFATCRAGRRAPATRSDAAWLACAESREREAFLDGLSDGALMALPWLFEFWALPHQLPPGGTWRSWVILGGRGAGKTRAGAEWVRAQVEGARPDDAGRARCVALLGETFDQVRDVMVMGESGIIACSPPDRRPVWEAGRRRLVWRNGAVAQAFSAQEPENLRGPQFDAAWADELAKWKRAGEVWDMLQFALRSGDDPRQVVTTTPRNVGVLKALLASPSTVATHAATQANAANLAQSFLREMVMRYGGRRLGRQELEGLLIEDVRGTLWPQGVLVAAQAERAPDLSRIVVAVDPPVTATKRSDACGIVVAGAVTEGPVETWRAWVLEDATVQGASPLEWAEAAVAAWRRHGADRIVAEVNQGGAMVETLIRQVEPLVPYRAVRATRGKALRAEPVAALYEQGRVRHMRHLGALEEQMARMTAAGFEGKGSPDRVDALVWALTELMLVPGSRGAAPRVRGLWL